MPRKLQFGDPLGRADVGDRLARAMPSTRAATPPIEWRKFCVNGNAPAAQFQNLLHEATNHAILHRTRQLFAAISNPVELAADVAGEYATYRFAFRTGTYHSALVAFATLQPPIGTVGDNASYARLKIFSDTTETTTVATADFYYGASPAGITFTSLRGWSFAKTMTQYISGLSPNTDYYACFYGVDGGTIQTATVIETQSMTEHVDGYLPTNLTQESEVLAIHRQRVATIQKNLWKHSGQSVLNWTVYDGETPLTNTGTTWTNIVDNSSTTIAASTPGFTLDMRNKIRRGQMTVPCVMKVFGEMEGLGFYGAIRLVSSDGTVVASIEDVWGASKSWQSVTFDMPATLDKYDLQFRRSSTSDAANGFWLYAVSIWEYEA